MKTKLTLLVAVLVAVWVTPAVAQKEVAQKEVAQNAAANYPSKPVRWIVPFPPGASNDITARLFAHKMSESMGQQFVIDNRPGAGGSIGAQLAAEAAPDGHTLLHANPGPSVNNIIMRRKSPYQLNDFAPVMFIGYTPLLILANPKFAANNGRELAAYAKANPGKLTWASSGNGSSLHIGLALFAAATGLDIVHVPYKGTAPALTDVMSGRVDVMHTTVVSADAQIKAGRVKVLAVAAPSRQAVLPNVPTLLEEGIKNAEATVWFGVQVSAKTPRPIINKLNAEMNRVMQMPDVQARLDQLGLVKAGGTPEEFGAFIKNEADKLGMLIKTKRVEMME
ncbi:MAG: Bug family tripartite tricarboxylate transporter substrate binding protein [Betaproteobacteria bacterium]